ncbi:hypothetical protein D6T64_02985 [Cryobacterium melibiosiphilum]|uniref:Uncharacterized protein n=1 Tax=Cryobacterium melibiosiphilum TaxID=995039 RepID=A0A3A5ML71_9MICO|nr:hypothetical protein D6T64_02985 [Cryobacterium melibiosiphilum]
MAALLAVASCAREQKPGSTDERIEVRGGILRVDLNTVDGDTYSAGVWDSETSLQIASFSPCFEMEGGHPARSTEVRTSSQRSWPMRGSRQNVYTSFIHDGEV